MVPTDVEACFREVKRRVQDEMYRRFRRDPIIVQSQGRKIKVELGGGSYISREYTDEALMRESPDALAGKLLDTYAWKEQEDGLLAYAKEKFPDAASVALLEDAPYDREVVVGVVELQFGGVRVLVGLTRELWDHTENFAELRQHMERHRWRDYVNSASSRKALLGQDGWVDKDDWS